MGVCEGSDGKGDRCGSLRFLDERAIFGGGGGGLVVVGSEVLRAGEWGSGMGWDGVFWFLGGGKGRNLA